MQANRTTPPAMDAMMMILVVLLRAFQRFLTPCGFSTSVRAADLTPGLQKSVVDKITIAYLTYSTTLTFS